MVTIKHALPDKQETTLQGGILEPTHLKTTAKPQVGLFLDNLPADFFLENQICIFNMQIRM